MKDNQQRIKDENPELNNIGRMSKIAEEWKEYKKTLMKENNSSSDEEKEVNADIEDNNDENEEIKIEQRRERKREREREMERERERKREREREREMERERERKRERETETERYFKEYQLKYPKSLAYELYKLYPSEKLKDLFYSYMSIYQDIKNKFPDIDIDFFIEYLNTYHIDETGKKIYHINFGIIESLYKIDLKTINYNKYIAYKLLKIIQSCQISIPSLKYNIIINEYLLFFNTGYEYSIGIKKLKDFINMLDAKIFMDNVNIKWSMLQFSIKNNLKSNYISASMPIPKSIPKPISKSIPKPIPKSIPKHAPKMSSKSPKMSSKSPKMSPKSPKMSSKSPKMSSKSPKMSSKSPKMSPKSPKMSPKSPKISPKMSPKMSPKSSPKLHPFYLL